MRVLLISGSTRRGSVNTAALATLAARAPAWVTPVLYDGLETLPALNPDDDGDRLPPAPAALRREIGAAVIEPACRDLHVPRSAVGPDGLVTDPDFAATGDALWAALTASTMS